MPDNIQTEKETVKNAASDSAATSDSGAAAAQASRETLSQQAIGEAIKGVGKTTAPMAQTARESLNKDSNSSTGKDILPNVIVGDTKGDRSQQGSASPRQSDLNSKADDISRQVRDGIINHEDLRNSLKDLLKPKEGVDKLATGDYLVKEDGKQSLFTPNGDRITINPDGSNTIKGDVKKVSTDKKGVTTVEFGDGATVSFDSEGFRSVNRGNQGVSFGRPNFKFPDMPKFEDNTPRLDLPKHRFEENKPSLDKQLLRPEDLNELKNNQMNKYENRK